MPTWLTFAIYLLYLMLSYHLWSMWRGIHQMRKQGYMVQPNVYFQCMKIIWVTVTVLGSSYLFFTYYI